MKRQTFSNIVRLSYVKFKNLNISGNNIDFWEALGDIYYYNKRMNNDLYLSSLNPNWKRIDKDLNQNSMKKPRMYASGIKEICKKHNIQVEFSSLEGNRNGVYAQYKIGSIDITNLINQ